MDTLNIDVIEELQDDVSVDVVELDELPVDALNGATLLGINKNVIRNVKVSLEVVLGGTDMKVGELFDLKKDSVVKLDRHLSALVDIRLDNNIVALGELVAVGDNFGVRISEITSWE